MIHTLVLPNFPIKKKKKNPKLKVKKKYKIQKTKKKSPKLCLYFFCLYVKASHQTMLTSKDTSQLSSFLSLVLFFPFIFYQILCVFFFFYVI